MPRVGWVWALSSWLCGGAAADLFKWSLRPARSLSRHLRCESFFILACHLSVEAAFPGFNGVVLNVMQRGRRTKYNSYNSLCGKTTTATVKEQYF